MPYGLGFSQSDINARCNKHFRKPTHNSLVKTKLKLAGLKVLKQKKTANVFLKGENGSSDILVEEKENVIKLTTPLPKTETIIEIEHSNGVSVDDRPDVIGGKQANIVGKFERMNEVLE